MGWKCRDENSISTHNKNVWKLYLPLPFHESLPFFRMTSPLLFAIYIYIYILLVSVKLPLSTYLPKGKLVKILSSFGSMDWMGKFLLCVVYFWGIIFHTCHMCKSYLISFIHSPKIPSINSINYFWAPYKYFSRHY